MVWQIGRYVPDRTVQTISPAPDFWLYLRVCEQAQEGLVGLTVIIWRRGLGNILPGAGDWLIGSSQGPDSGRGMWGCAVS